MLALWLAVRSVTATSAQPSSKQHVNLEDATLLAGGARVKFKARWMGSLQQFLNDNACIRRHYEQVATDLSRQMSELEELGVTPIAADGKVSTRRG